MRRVVKISYPKDEKKVAPSFAAYGSSRGYFVVRGRMVHQDGRKFWGKLLQRPRIWIIHFTDLPEGNYTLEISSLLGKVLASKRDLAIGASGRSAIQINAPLTDETACAPGNTVIASGDADSGVPNVAGKIFNNNISRDGQVLTPPPHWVMKFVGVAFSPPKYTLEVWKIGDMSVKDSETNITVSNC